MKKFLIGTAAFVLISASVALAQDSGSDALRGLDLAKDQHPGMGAMRSNRGEAVLPDGEIAGFGALNDPGNGGTYPTSGPQAYVPDWKPIR